MHFVWNEMIVFSHTWDAESFEGQKFIERRKVIKTMRQDQGILEILISFTSMLSYSLHVTRQRLAFHTLTALLTSLIFLNQSHYYPWITCHFSVLSQIDFIFIAVYSVFGSWNKLSMVLGKENLNAQG